MERLCQLTLSAVLADIVRHPVERLVRRWNWKSAVCSAAIRGAIFFAVNLTHGIDAASAALTTELVFRLVTTGFYGALTERLRLVEPAWQGTIAAMLIQPAISHTLEYGVHWMRGTVELGASIAASVAFTMISTAFNIFAMRRGALLVGNGSASLAHDLRRMPALIAAFLVSVATLPWRLVVWLISGRPRADSRRSRLQTSTQTTSAPESPSKPFRA